MQTNPHLQFFTHHQKSCITNLPWRPSNKPTVEADLRNKRGHRIGQFDLETRVRNWFHEVRYQQEKRRRNCMTIKAWGNTVPVHLNSTLGLDTVCTGWSQTRVTQSSGTKLLTHWKPLLRPIRNGTPAHGISELFVSRKWEPPRASLRFDQPPKVRRQHWKVAN